MNRVSRSQNPQTFKIFQLSYLTDFNHSYPQLSSELSCYSLPVIFALRRAAVQVQLAPKCKQIVLRLKTDSVFFYSGDFFCKDWVTGRSYLKGDARAETINLVPWTILERFSREDVTRAVKLKEVGVSSVTSHGRIFSFGTVLTLGIHFHAKMMWTCSIAISAVQIFSFFILVRLLLLFFDGIVSERGSNMRASPRYYLLVTLFGAMMFATCRTRPMYSNTWVVQVDGGLTGAERIAAEKDLMLLGQVREQSLMIYRVVIALVISWCAGSSITREFNLSTDLRFSRFCLLTKRETFFFCLCR